MSNNTTLKFRFVLCMALALLWGPFSAGTGFAAAPATPATSGASSDEALLRMEERRRVIAQRMERSTVFILTISDGELSGLGTGFVVADGHVMTNAHVVNGGDEWYVAAEGMSPVKARVIKSEYDQGVVDYALLRFSPNVSLPPLTFNTQVGRMDRVSAWGFPYIITQFDQNMGAIEQGTFKGMPPLVYTEGVVSTLVHNENSKNIFHTASIASGNSGGPLINSWGEVVGINTWSYMEKDEISAVNAALPADRIVAFIRSCGVEPQLSTRGGSPLQAALAPNHVSPPSAESASSSAQQPRRGIASVPKTSPSTSTPPQSPHQDELIPGLSEEMQDLYRAASRGDAPSQAAVGLAYFTGNGAPKNIPEAARWVSMAAEQGDNEAIYLLGILHMYEPEYKDNDKALKLLRKAADTDADYASTLAMLLLDGESLGVERDAEQAAVYAKRGVTAGDTDAVAVLAFLTFFGLGGLDEDAEKALQLAQQAEKEEAPLALTVLGWMSYLGDGMPVSESRALSYATDAAESEEAHAMGLLAFMYYYGVDKLPPDKEKAEGWALRAVDQCNEYGQFVLGMLYKDEASAQKKIEAWAHLDMAARYLVSAEEERDALTKKLTSTQLRQAKELSTKLLDAFGLPANW